MTVGLTVVFFRCPNAIHFRWSRSPSISRSSVCVHASVGAEFCVRKVEEANLTMMMKVKDIQYDELTLKPHDLLT